MVAMNMSSITAQIRSILAETGYGHAFVGAIPIPVMRLASHPILRSFSIR